MEKAKTVLAGAMLNIGATAQYLEREPEREVVIVCAGTFREAALEDVLAAGMLVSLLGGRSLSDSAQMAVAVYRQGERDLRGAMGQAKNGRALIVKGRGAEVDWCAQASIYPLVARMDQSRITVASG